MAAVGFKDGKNETFKASAHFFNYGPRVLDVILKLNNRNQCSKWKTMDLYRDVLNGKYGKTNPTIDVQTALRGMAYTLDVDTDSFMYFGGCMACYFELRPGDIERAGGWAEGSVCAVFMYLGCYYKLLKNELGAATALNCASRVCKTSRALEIIKTVFATGEVGLVQEIYPYHKITSGVRLSHAYEVIRYGNYLRKMKKKNTLRTFLFRQPACTQLYIEAAELYLSATETLCPPGTVHDAIEEFKQICPWEPESKPSSIVFSTSDPLAVVEQAYGVTFNRLTNKVSTI